MYPIAKPFIGASSFLILLASSAFAADIPFEAPVAPAPLVAPTAYSWTGFYVGVFGGIGSGSTEIEIDFDDNSGSFFDNSRLLELEDRASGFFGGIKAGFDYQFGNFVIGAVADIAATDIRSDRRTFDTFNDAGSDEMEYKLDYLGTVRARLGYAMDRLLVYAHGGFAYADTSIETSSSDDDFDGDMKYGYVVGAGIEYAVTDRISLQTEYAFTDLGEDDISVGSDFGRAFTNGFGDAGDIDASEDINFHTLRVGVNYRF